MRRGRWAAARRSPIPGDFRANGRSSQNAPPATRFGGWDFSRDEIERYARHIVLADVGGPGQQKLKRARVLVVGAGGLGAPVIQYLAAAGVGTLGIVDDDRVSLSNLQRQVIHATAAVGTLKVEARRPRDGHAN